MWLSVDCWKKTKCYQDKEKWSLEKKIKQLLKSPGNNFVKLSEKDPLTFSKQWNWMNVFLESLLSQFHKLYMGRFAKTIACLNRKTVYPRKETCCVIVAQRTWFFTMTDKLIVLKKVTATENVQLFKKWSTFITQRFNDQIDWYPSRQWTKEWLEFSLMGVCQQWRNHLGKVREEKDKIKVC